MKKKCCRSKTSVRVKNIFNDPLSRQDTNVDSLNICQWKLPELKNKEKKWNIISKKFGTAPKYVSYT